jgi:PAS domain S-box-containing protein
MRILISSIRRFFATMGLVEQSQMVASTAVVVAMATIVTAHFVVGRPIGWMDFMTIITVGSIGYMSVFFSLKYGRILEQQRRELLELNTISEAVNHSVELDLVLQNALEKVMELTQADCGWIYLTENQTLVLRHQSGTRAPFFAPDVRGADEALIWFRRPSILQVDDAGVFPYLSEECRREQIKRVASIPLVRQGTFAGALIIGGEDPRKFQSKKSALLHAFGNQISLALNNAWLYEQVRQSERLYADLYENSPDMYHSVNRDGVVVGCNKTESLLLGLPKNQIIGRALLDLYPERQRAGVQQNLRKIFELGQELKGIEEQVQRSDGSLIDVSVNTSTVYDPQGRAVMARMVLRDITEKKRMEAKILQAQKIDSIGNLAGGIAHDFNNILTAILGSASIMRRKVKEDQRWIKYVDLIETTSRRGAAVTRQLLTFARKNNPHVRPIDLNSIIDQTVRLFEATTPRTIHIKCTLSPEPVIVDGDEGQMQQALLNLCLNARDAMPNGGVLVINCRPITLDEEHAQQVADGKPGDYVMITIADSGTGIPQEIVNQIWEPFFTTKEQGKGTGLGLSVVYGVIRGHQGHINVNSEVDSGTIFTMYLPQSKNGRTERAVAPNVAELPGGHERVLLIEDEISVGEVGADILEELGYAIDVARTGREAIQKLATATRPFDLVILDMNMPRMGGRATFERIKEMFPQMRVLVCSGYSATMLDDGKFTESIDGFLQKPYELEEIAQKIRQILDADATVPRPAPPPG